MQLVKAFLAFVFLACSSQAAPEGFPYVARVRLEAGRVVEYSPMPKGSDLGSSPASGTETWTAAWVARGGISPGPSNGMWTISSIEGEPVIVRHPDYDSEEAARAAAMVQLYAEFEATKREAEKVKAVLKVPVSIETFEDIEQKLEQYRRILRYLLER